MCATFSSFDLTTGCSGRRPTAAFDRKRRRWRNKEDGDLFNHKALASVYRGKVLAGITQAELPMPEHYPKEWVVDCKAVGSGEKALIYLGGIFTGA